MVFSVTQQYAEIEPWINKITSKATCDAPYETFLVQDPITKQFVKFYSINVTGTSSSPGDFVPPPLKHHLLHLRRRIVATETLKGMEAMGTLLTMKKILQKTYLNKNN